MMTIQNVTEVLKLLEANYGDDFYRGTNRTDVLKLWAATFAEDDPAEVLKAVQNCINTLPYKPKIADIRRRMAGNVMRGQMTEIEAFLCIKTAVNDAGDRESAIAAFDRLPGICQKLAGTPNQLRDWRRVSDEAFETVVASMIRSSYRELAQREADYYALPERLQKVEAWRIEAGPKVDNALPAPEPLKYELPPEWDRSRKVEMTEKRAAMLEAFRMSVPATNEAEENPVKYSNNGLVSISSLLEKMEQDQLK